MRSSLTRIFVAARYLAADLIRHRLALVLLFVVPLLFNVIVHATTSAHLSEVTLASLVEDGAEIYRPGDSRRTFSLGLLDDGARTLTERGVSYVFMGIAAVCFLTSFLAFNLVNRRRDVDARLVLAGYRTHEVLFAKLIVLAGVVALLAAYESGVLAVAVHPKHLAGVYWGLFHSGLIYGSFGFLIGAIARQELEGLFLIVLLTNIDAGWLQNPIYYATSESRWIIRSLPAFNTTQIAFVAAFTDDVPQRAPHLHSIGYALLLLAGALAALGLRIRRRGPAGKMAGRS